MQPVDVFQAFLDSQTKQDVLRFITCGSVDDGKSTLIGRLLWDANQLYDDQRAALERDSHRFGTQGEAIDYALLVDGLAAEREQGITIDVAYRFFATEKRKFIVADTPGHEQYTRNMVTGASTADVALLLVDASQGLLPQTHRHAYLVALMGIRHVVLVVNKMDKVGYAEEVFRRIETDFKEFCAKLPPVSITAIPVSALTGVNVIERSNQCGWYAGKTLIEYLESVDLDQRVDNAPFIYPVQWVNRPNADFRGFAGTLASGKVEVGQPVRITASGQTANIARIVTMDGDLQSASVLDSVTLTLDREVDVSRGDVMTLADAPIEMTDQFEAHLVWMHQDEGLVGRSYDLKLASQWVSASITAIKHKVNVSTFAAEASRSLQLNDISLCNIALSRPIAYTTYADCRTMGGFILVDRFTQATVAAGMITHSLRRAQNVHKQSLAITRAHREEINGQKGRVIWFTGLSGSGKSTIANALEVELHRQGKRCYILDGDNIRQGVSRDLGFTNADRVENIRRVAEIAKLMLDAGLIVITAFISPFASERKMARELLGEDFMEVFVDTPLEVCEARDVKGLYKKARSGNLPNMTGISSPYEAPLDPEVVLNGAHSSVEEQVSLLLQAIKQ